MRIFILCFVAFVASTSHADPLSNFLGAFAGNAFKPEPYRFGILRLAGGASMGKAYDLKPVAEFEELEKSDGHWAEIDLMILHFGYSQVNFKDAKVDFNGGGMDAAEIGYDRYQYGFKLTLPIPYINPFIGGGFMSGIMHMRNAASASEKEHSRLTGRYWHAGLDLMILPHAGIRLSYQNDTIKTRKFDILGNTAVELENHIGQAGLMLYF